MNVICKFRTVQLGQTAREDLIAIAGDEGFDYALNLGPTDGGDIVLAVVGPASGGAPYRTIVSDDVDCLTYGSDWILEISDKAVSPHAQGTSTEKPGAVIVVGQEVLMKLGADPHRPTTRGGTVNLRTLNVTGTLPGQAVAAESWRMWVNDADQADDNASPILESSADVAA